MLKRNYDPGEMNSRCYKFFSNLRGLLGVASAYHCVWNMMEQYWELHYEIQTWQEDRIIHTERRILKVTDERMDEIIREWTC